MQDAVTLDMLDEESAGIRRLDGKGDDSIYFLPKYRALSCRS